MDQEDQLETIISLLKNLLLRIALPQGKDIQYWKCACGMENITLASDPKECLICNRLEPLRIEGPR